MDRAGRRDYFELFDSSRAKDTCCHSRTRTRKTFTLFLRRLQSTKVQWVDKSLVKLYIQLQQGMTRLDRQGFWTPILEEVYKDESTLWQVHHPCS